MCKEKKAYQYYIGIGLIVSSLGYLLYESGMIIDIVRLGLYIVGISLEIIGVVKYRQSR
ncbi:MAG: hypothetical protein RR585_04635 [Coprobacillus sp.]